MLIPGRRRQLPLMTDARHYRQCLVELVPRHRRRELMAVSSHRRAARATAARLGHPERVL